ncbi:MAG TPA: hypothetical protein VHS56_02580 [Candidatus Cybelea sp.]|jgi:hypothetical protein|nr:hypothetical protein [Candidatus Cybelea sp.]
MFLNPALSAALDRITERAADVRRAFVPGSVPQHDDVATPAAISDFTLDPLSVYAPGGVYFVARDARGESGFTSDGSFALRDGRLEDRDGRAICGRDDSDRPVELRVDSIDEALGRAANARIEADGSLVYERTSIDPRSGMRASRRIVAGRLALARFPAGTRLSEKDGLRVAPPGVDAQLGTAGRDGFAALEPLHRSRSRVDLDESLARLKEAYIAFDALQAAETAKGHLGKTAMDLLK